MEHFAPESTKAEFTREWFERHTADLARHVYTDAKTAGRRTDAEAMKAVADFTSKREAEADRIFGRA